MNAIRFTWLRLSASIISANQLEVVNIYVGANDASPAAALKEANGSRISTPMRNQSVALLAVTFFLSTTALAADAKCKPAHLRCDIDGDTKLSVVPTDESSVTELQRFLTLRSDKELEKYDCNCSLSLDENEIMDMLNDKRGKIVADWKTMADHHAYRMEDNASRVRAAREDAAFDLTDNSNDSALIEGWPSDPETKKLSMTIGGSASRELGKDKWKVEFGVDAEYPSVFGDIATAVLSERVMSTTIVEKIGSSLKIGIKASRAVTESGPTTESLGTREVVEKISFIPIRRQWELDFEKKKDYALSFYLGTLGREYVRRETLEVGVPGTTPKSENGWAHEVGLKFEFGESKCFALELDYAISTRNAFSGLIDAELEPKLTWDWLCARRNRSKDYMEESTKKSKRGSREE